MSCEMAKKISGGRKSSEGILLASGSLNSFMAVEIVSRNVCAWTASLITLRRQKMNRGHQIRYHWSQNLKTMLEILITALLPTSYSPR